MFSLRSTVKAIERILILENEIQSGAINIKESGTLKTDKLHVNVALIWIAITPYLIKF